MGFTRAIVRAPGGELDSALRTGAPGRIDIDRAARQHAGYVAALGDLGVAVTALPPLAGFPDATFVEDVAVLAGELAVLSRPGTPTRAGEVAHIEAALRDHFPAPARIEAPGHLDGGDVLAIGRHHLIGLSARTDAAGAEQLLAHLARHGFTGEVVAFEGMLHLKSGLAWLGGEELLVAPALDGLRAIAPYRRHIVPGAESQAANSILVNDGIVMPAGHRCAAALVRATGRVVVEVEVGEFQKLDGGVSCLSLRFGS